MPNVPRTIQFYRMVEFDKSVVPPTRAQLFGAISKIDPALDKFNWEHKKGENLCVWNDTVARANVNEIRFCLGKIRHRNIPGTVISGSRENLSASNVFEPVHLVMFDNRVVGIERNQYGAHAAAALPRYMSEVCPNLPVFYLKPLFDRDIVQTLNRFSELSFVRFVLEREKVGMLTNADEVLSDSLSKISAKYPSAIIDLMIKIRKPDTLDPRKENRKAQKESRYTVSQQFSTAVFNEVLSIVSDASALGSFDKFEVHGIDNRTNKATTIDLLTRLIMTSKNIELVDETHGMVKRDKMYEAIIEAEADLRTTLRTAVAAG